MPSLCNLLVLHYSCPNYTNLPSGCYLVQQEGACCRGVQCQSGSFYSSSPNIQSLGNGGLLQVLNPMINGQSIAPQPYTGYNIPAGGGGTGFIAPTLRKSFVILSSREVCDTTNQERFLITIQSI